jgi:hypothetical protein
MGLKKIAKKLGKGLIGGEIGGLIGFAFPGYGLLGYAAGFAIGSDLLGMALKELVKIPKLPDTLAEQGQDYRVEFRNNKIAAGDRKAVGYGEFRVWFKGICTYPIWVDSQQVWLFYGLVGRGVYEMLDLNIGTTPVGNFGRQRSLLLGPGEPLPADFMCADMYVSPDVGEQELQAGGIRLIEEASNTVTVTTGTVPGTSRLTRSNFWDGAFVDAVLIIKNGASAGSYTIRARDGGAEPNWIEIEPAIANGSYTSAFAWQAYESDGVTITVPKKDAPAVSLTFTAGPDEVQGPDDALGVFNPRDLLVAQGGLNDGLTYTVVWTNGSDTLGLSPAPIPDTTTSTTLRLLRRRTAGVYGCSRGARVRKSVVVLGYPQGLGFAKGENPNDRTITYELRWRSVDDAGNPLTPWTTRFFDQTDRTTNKARYHEHVIEYPDAIRPEITLARITYLPDDSRYVDNASWIQLRSEIVPVPGEDPANDPLYTRVAIMVGVTGQLNAERQQNFNGLMLRWLPQYMEGEWSAPAPTRSRVWALADWLAHESDGTVGYDDLSGPMFAARAADGDARNAHFDAMIDTEVPYWETALQIADGDRLVPYLELQTHVIALARDEPSAPVAAFAHGFACQVSGLKLSAPTSQTKFGVRAIYTDPATWQQRDDGPVYGDDTDPREITVFGCKEFRPAYDAAKFDYLMKRLRVITATMSVAREGLSLRVHDRVWIAHPIGMGQTSEIVTLEGNTLRVRQPITWQAGAQHYVILQGAGAPSERINVTRGSSNQVLVLASTPSITLHPYGGPKPNLCLFGWDAAEGVRANGPRIAICESGSADGLRNASVQLRFDDERVYEPTTEYPEDPLETEGELPALALTGLAVAFTGGKWVASTDANASARAYEWEAKWSGELGWRRANFGASNSAVIPTAGGGVLMVRVRAYGDASIGPYTAPVSSNVDGGALAATLSRYTVNDAVNRPSTRVYGYAQGGTPTYSYLWVRTSGSTAITPSTPTSPDTAFPRSGFVPPGGLITATFVLRITDSLGATADSEAVVVTIYNYSAGVEP